MNLCTGDIVQSKSGKDSVRSSKMTSSCKWPIIFNFYVSLFLQDKNYIFLNNRNLKNLEVCELKSMGFKKVLFCPHLISRRKTAFHENSFGNLFSDLEAKRAKKESVIRDLDYLI